MATLGSDATLGAKPLQYIYLQQLNIQYLRYMSVSLRWTRLVGQNQDGVKRGSCHSYI